MQKLDMKSAMIGSLIASIAILGVAAASDMHSGRYSFSTCASSTPGTFVICVGDTATGKYALEKCVEQIPATSSMITRIGTYPNPLKETPGE